MIGNEKHFWCRLNTLTYLRLRTIKKSLLKRTRISVERCNIWL